MTLLRCLTVCITLLSLNSQRGMLQASLRNASRESASALCPGNVMVIECSVMGGGSTVWNGTAFRCDGDNHNFIALRHTQFKTSEKPQGSCNSGAIVAHAIRVVNNSYISQLNVTVSPEMNNTIVDCVHDYNLTSVVIKSTSIILTRDTSLNPPPVHAMLGNVSRGELTFIWNKVNDQCSSLQYFIDSNDCGYCPHETYNNFVSCKNVSVNKLCSFAVRINTSDSLWSIENMPLNISLKVPETPEVQIIPSYMQESLSSTFIVRINCTIKKTKPFNFSNEVDGSAIAYKITYSAIRSQLNCETVDIQSSSFDGDFFSHTFEVLSSSCHFSDIAVIVFATNVLGDGPSYPSVIEAENSLIHIEVDITNEIIFCVLEGYAAENSSCIIQAIFELQQKNCNNYSFEIDDDDYYRSRNVSFAHLPRNEIFCYVAEAQNSSSTIILLGSFGTPTGVSHGLSTAATGALFSITTVLVIAIVLPTVAVCILKRRRKKQSMEVTQKSHILGSMIDHIRTYIHRCIHMLSTREDMSQREVIYADINIQSNPYNTERILDDDRIMYATLNHSLQSCHPSTMASSVKQDEPLLENKYACNLDNLLIQLRSEVTPYWYEFGTIVGISKETLEKYSKHPSKESIIEVLDYWLRNHYNKPTWKEVANLLKELKLNELAEKILKCYETENIPIEVDMDAVSCLTTYEEDQCTPPPLPPKP